MRLGNTDPSEKLPPPWQAVSSSVARRGRGGGGEAIALPIDIQSMQNTSFLALLRPTFALRTIIVPNLALSIRSAYFNPGFEENLVTKVDPSLDEDLFFNLQLILGSKPVLFQVKTVSVWFYTSYTAPPPTANSWLRAWPLVALRLIWEEDPFPSKHFQIRPTFARKSNKN